MNATEKFVTELIAEGERLNAVVFKTWEDAEQFVADLDIYLSKIRELELQLNTEKIDPKLGEEFLATHKAITQRAETEKSEILKNITELHKRSNVLRTYLDQLPERISITGKREG